VARARAAPTTIGAIKPEEWISACAIHEAVHGGGDTVHGSGGATSKSASGDLYGTGPRASICGRAKGGWVHEHDQYLYTAAWGWYCLSALRRGG